MFNSIIKIFSLGKLYYKSKNNTKSVLIFDHATSNLLENYLDKDEIDYFYSRREKFEIGVFFSTLFQKGFKDFGKRYFLNFLKKYKPKYLISLWFVNSLIYEVKKKFPEIKIIIIQSHIFSKPNFNYIKKFDSSSIDYIYVWRNYEKNIFQKFFHKSKIIVIGSIKNNHFYKYKEKLIKKFLYFSEYKVSRISYNEETTLSILDEFCKNHKIKFDIQIRYRKISEEYNKFLKSKNFQSLDKVLTKEDQGTPYKNSNYYEFLVLNSSSLVDEFLANLKKVAVIESFDNFDEKVYFDINKGKTTDDFTSNPMFKETNANYFWTTNIDKLKVDKVLSNLIYSTKEQYDTEIKKYDSKVFYNQNNQILKESLSKIGLPVLLDKKLIQKNDN